MTKPVNLDEMVLRVRALLRRSHIASNKRLTLPHTILDYDALTVTWKPFHSISRGDLDLDDVESQEVKKKLKQSLAKIQ